MYSKVHRSSRSRLRFPNHQNAATTIKVIMRADAGNGARYADNDGRDRSMDGSFIVGCKSHVNMCRLRSKPMKYIHEIRQMEMSTPNAIPA